MRTQHSVKVSPQTKRDLAAETVKRATTQSKLVDARNVLWKRSKEAERVKALRTVARRSVKSS